MSLDALRALLDRAGARRLAADAPVWELAAPWWPFSRRARRHAALRLELLEEVLAMGGPAFLQLEDNPQDYDVGGVWTHAGELTWRVPEACPVARLEARVLSIGNWSLYLAHRAVEGGRLPDAFRVAPGELAAFATRESIPVLVQSFHDGEPWRIALEEQPVREHMAA